MEIKEPSGNGDAYNLLKSALVIALLVLSLLGALVLILSPASPETAHTPDRNVAALKIDPYEINTTKPQRNYGSGVLVRVRHTIGATPLPDLRLEFDGKDVPSEAIECRTKQDGSYGVPLPAGNYRVRATFLSDSSGWFDFRVEPSELSEVKLTIGKYPFVIVSGNVRSQGGGPISGALIRLDLPEETEDKLDDKAYDEIHSLFDNVYAETGKDGSFLIRCTLRPSDYLIDARATNYSQGFHAAPVFKVPPNVGLLRVSRNVTLIPLIYTDLVGRVFGPAGHPIKQCRIVARHIWLDGQGTPKGFIETVHHTDEDGIYRIRTNYPRVAVLTLHPDYGLGRLEVNGASLGAPANAEQPVDPLYLEDKSSKVKVKLVAQDTLEPIQAELEVREFPPGPDPIIFLGNTHFTVRSSPEGDGAFGVDPSNRYDFRVPGYQVSRVEGSNVTRSRTGYFNFQSGGGTVTIYLRQK